MVRKSGYRFSEKIMLKSKKIERDDDSKKGLRRYDPLQAPAPSAGFVGRSYSLADLLGGLMSTINAATICIAAAKANDTT